MTEPDANSAVRVSSPRRIVVFGVTGQLGQELVGRLDESDWPIAELVGVASSTSVGNDFEFRGDELDVLGEAPPLKGFDLVFICTRGAQALEIVRDCLRSEVPCLDLTGALSAQAEVPMARRPEEVEASPVIGLPSPTSLAWALVMEAVGRVAPLKRVRGTVLSSASAMGHKGLLSLSEESIALFNQSEPPPVGPAGQGVAFDVIPGGGIDAERVRTELGRIFGEGVGIDVASLQVPTFVGEGTSLAFEFESSVDRADLEASLSAQAGISVRAQGLGSRGLEAVDEDAPLLSGPTLRDVAGIDEIQVGPIEADTAASPGHGWRVWLAVDPLRIAAGHAVEIGARRLGFA